MIAPRESSSGGAKNITATGARDDYSAVRKARRDRSDGRKLVRAKQQSWVLPGADFLCRVLESIFLRTIGPRERQLALSSVQRGELVTMIYARGVEG